ncbi:hypothetical protein GCM10007315_03340 [Gemmobacter tilapiae]|uniref:Uncharacterized protein n=1 Tax=Neogemmobacter tilapiae TaxID=875041 RepID=A0A918WGT9_9RHOB|nr:hypothetical protein GCM10007315_03340 [Gemmobacter tilapiae]
MGHERSAGASLGGIEPPRLAGGCPPPPGLRPAPGDIFEEKMRGMSAPHPCAICVEEGRKVGSGFAALA